MRIDPAQTDTKDLYRWMISSVVPRPIAWVSTQSPDGVPNAAPFSYFQAVSSRPPTLMISAGKKRDGAPKDTRRNILDTGEFVVNVVSEASAAKMVATSDPFDAGVSEFAEVGLEPEPSELVAPPRIKECAVAFECRRSHVHEVGNSAVVFGEVLLVHVRDDVLGADGFVDPWKLRPLGRLGGSCYAPLREVDAIRPGEEPQLVDGEMIELWDELRRQTIAMARGFTPEQLAREGGGMTVGRMLRHMAACTHYRVLLAEGREDEDEHRAWDETWTGARLADELEADRQQFLREYRKVLPRESHALKRMIRHEAWHQGQMAALLRPADLW